VTSSKADLQAQASRSLVHALDKLFLLALKEGDAQLKDLFDLHRQAADSKAFALNAPHP
jgi:hypothetical protein